MVYSYAVGTYDGAGNVKQVTDSVTGAWSYGYDNLNRLITSTPASGPYLGYNGCWSYDAFGNRTAESYQPAACPAPSIPPTLSPTATYNGNNQVTWTSVNAAVNGFTYDAAGDVLNDGINQYVYDAEGRITCTVSAIGGGSCTSTAGIHYAYDADGLRVARYSGTTLTSQYLYNAESLMVTELDGANNWVRGEVFARGSYLATYYNSTTTFAHGDWLGTIRYRTNLDGSQAETCASLPFGDGQYCTGTDPSNKHFTGKLRDEDTGLDYFGARYYASPQGRFLTPDWSATPEAVPYGHFETPQSMNLYAYVKNNPITDVDADGHDGEGPGQDGWLGNPNGGGNSDNSNRNGGKKGRGTIYDPDSWIRFLLQSKKAQQQGPANMASGMDGTKAYLQGTSSKYPAGTNKCNEFVADMVQASGRDRPQVKKSGILGWLGFTRDPTAKEWASGAVPGYKVISIADAQRGDIIAMGHHDDNEGHVGIYMGGGQTASVNALTNPAGIVTVNAWGFRGAGNNGEHPGDSGPVALRYVGDN